ncbi:MAG: tRNA dihydrouridine synthase DusB [Eubacteriales bacterium]
MSQLQIGNVLLENNLILAPMAGVTDLPFRVLCKEQGAGLVCMEMVSAKAITYQNQNTESLMQIHPKEGPVSLQLFGSKPTVIRESIKRIDERPFAILDFNMGCPMPKIVNNGEGSALLKNPKLVEEILTVAVKATKKPVTVKIRKGFYEEQINAVEIAKIAESCGVAAVAVHGRTREQYYSGTADWEIIRAVKEAVKIPVIGNGDVTDYESAKRLQEVSNCDGIMIGRASRGNPFLFAQLKKAFETNEAVEKPSKEELLSTILQHAKLQLQYKGDYIGIREMRKHVAWYTVGLYQAAKLRNRIHQIESFEELEDTVRSIF